MPVAQRHLDIGTRRGNHLVLALSEEIRRARLEHGLSQSAVADAVRISRPQFGRIERGENKAVSVLVLAQVLAVLGLELRARAYPVGQPIRDAAHRALLDRAKTALGPRVLWSYERPIGDRDSSRAWDGRGRVDEKGLGIETETRISDMQALQRRVHLKLRDDPSVAAALIVVANTRHNRHIVRLNLDALQEDFEVLRPSDLPAWLPTRSALVVL